MKGPMDSTSAGLHFSDGAKPGITHLSHARLDALRLGAAEHFRRQGVLPHSTVILPFHNSIEAFLSFLGLVELGACILSIRPGQSYSDVLGCSPKTETRCAKSPVFLAEDSAMSPGDDALTRITLADTSMPLEGQPRTPNESEIAFIQFSSGTGGSPKGLEVSHGNLKRNIHLILNNEGRTSNTRAASWLPLCHDMGLIGLLSCLECRCEAHQTNPMDFLRDPIDWLRYLSHHRINVVPIPSFAIGYLLRRIHEGGPQCLSGVNLEHLSTLYVGGDLIDPDALEQLTTQLRPFGFRRSAITPCYGMAEAVLIVSCVRNQATFRTYHYKPGIELVGCGPPLDGFTVRIVGTTGETCLDGVIGEIAISGSMLSASCLTTTQPPSSSEPGKAWLMTGDLGLMHDGELYPCGRMCDRIRINAQTIFPALLEREADRLHFSRQGRSVAIQCADQKIHLGIEVDSLWPLILVHHYKQRVTEQIYAATQVKIDEEAVHFLRRGTILKTTSGKLRRREFGESIQSIKDDSVPRWIADLCRYKLVRLRFALQACKQKKTED